MAPPRQPGSSIAGRYVLDVQLGSGAFGQVWSAHDARAFNRRVAVKFLLEQHLTNADVVERFWREGQATAALTHPNVVALLEFGQDDGVPYLVNEYVEGESLRSALDRREETGVLFTNAEALSVFGQICDGVGAAHAKGIVHRDLKPENVMILASGSGFHLKVLDFGVARILDKGTGNRGQTESGRIIGSLQYMAPEQVLGDTRAIDQRSDLFALGALLFEILALRQAFKGESFHEIVTQILQGPIPKVTSLRPDLPSAVDDLITQALATRPAERFQTAAALRTAAERVLGTSSESPALQTGRRPAIAVDSGDAWRMEGNTLDAAERPDRSDPPRSPASKRSALGWTVSALLAVVAVASGAVYLARARTHRDPAPIAPRPIIASVAANPPPARVTPPAVTPDDAPADWALVTAPAQPFVLGRADGSEGPHGFTAHANVRFAGPSFRMQRREISWRAYEHWAQGHEDREVRPPAWLPPSMEARADLPVVGVRWEQARAYCQSLGGDLPTEEQWEYAARGSARRLAPWGRAALPNGVAALLGDAGQPHAVGASTADRTPEGIDDLGANAQEWTASPYRTDEGEAPAWTATLRAIRGLPLRDARPSVIPAAGLFRNSGCVGDACAPSDRTVLETVGFRCVRGDG